MGEYRNLPAVFEIKSLSERGGWFAGYASVFDEVDSQNDRVVRGAFQENLKHWQKQGALPKMLWQHESAKPIGRWTKVAEDRSGLYVEGNLLLDLEKAREAYVLMKASVLDSLSIGYRVLESIQGRKSSIRLLTKIELVEISLVTFAANSKAKITSLKKKAALLTELSF